MPISPGPPATPANLAAAKLMQEAAAEELTRVQRSAQGWATALAGMIGLIGTLTVVKGEATIGDLSREYEIGVVALVMAALATGVTGAYWAARAAYGLPTIVETGKLALTRHQAARRAKDALQGAIRLTFLTIALAAAALVTSWFAVQAEASFLKVVTPAGEHCGKVVSSSANSVTIKDGSIEPTVALRDVSALDVVTGCD